VVELSLGYGVNNSHTFAIGKAQRKRGTFNLKYNIKSSIFQSPECSLSENYIEFTHKIRRADLNSMECSRA
jgi:hypothetical protein